MIHTIAGMKQAMREARAKHRVIGLVPTMGALHEGHLSLAREARKRCSPVVVSIFVNPKQFGPSEDFQKYPRPLEADLAALEKLDVDYLFAPSSEEVYPRGFCTSVAVEGLSERLEGRSRPGHFRGVATIVLKLLEIVQPDAAFFGRKDAQQLRIIRQMVSDLALGTQVTACPIVREPDGLALSSRNAYLRGNDRRAATVLHRSLEAVGTEIAKGERNAARLLACLRSVLEAEPAVRLDYAEIVDADSFDRIESIQSNCYVLIAAFVGATRLIDNAFIEQDGDAYHVTL